MRKSVAPRAAEPIARHLLFETTDLDEACERVGDVFCRHRIDYSGTGRRLAFRQNLVPMGRVALSYVTYGEDVEIDAGEPGDWFMVHSVLSGACSMTLGGRHVLLSPGTDAISSATLGLRMKWSAGCGQLVLKVDRPALERHLCHLLQRDIRQPIEFMPDLSAASASGYRRLLDFVTAEAEEEETLFSSGHGVRHLEETLMTMLLLRFPHNHSATLRGPVSPAVPRHVRLAEEFIRAHAGEPITIGDVAHAAGVGLRTLFEGFQRFRGVTPMAWLRSIRMERVHHELLEAHPAASVTEIAMKWGFTNLGRFSDGYRRRYGELPSQTLRQARPGTGPRMQ